MHRVVGDVEVVVAELVGAPPIVVAFSVRGFRTIQATAARRGSVYYGQPGREEKKEENWTESRINRTAKEMYQVR